MFLLLFKILIIGFVAAAPDGWLSQFSIPDMRPLNAAVSGDAELEWSQKIDLHKVVGIAPFGELLIAYSPYEIIGVSAEDGAERWHLTQVRRLFNHDSDDRLYVARNDREVAAIDPATGQDIWATTLPDDLIDYDFLPDQIAVIVGRPTKGDEEPAPSETYRLALLNRTTGATIWTARMPSERLFFNAQPNRLIVRAESGVMAFDRLTGRELWSELFRGEQDYADVTVFDDVAVIVETWVDRPGGVRAVDLATGSNRWEMTTETCIQGIAAWAGEIIGVTCQSWTAYDDFTVTGIDLRDGTPRWKADPWSQGIDMVPSASRSFVSDAYFTSGMRLLALDLTTGQTAWTAEIGPFAYLSQWMFRTDDLIFFQIPENPGDDRFSVLSINRATGMLNWMVPITDASNQFVTLRESGGYVLANTERRLVAIKTDTGIVEWSLEVQRDERSAAASGNADWGFIVDVDLADRAFVLTADGYLFSVRMKAPSSGA